MGIVQIHYEVGTPLSAEDPGGDSHAGYLPRLIALAEAQGITVVFGNLDELKRDRFGMKPHEILYGAYFWDEKVLYINTDQSLNGQVSTFLHELGHAFQPKKLIGHRGQDVFAQVVSALVTDRLGLDTVQSSVTYLRFFPREWWVAQLYSREIEAVALKLYDGVR